VHYLYNSLPDTHQHCRHAISNIHRVHIKKVPFVFFHNNIYKCAPILTIFGVQLCKWILMILVDLLHYTSCTSCTWWRNVDVSEITSCTWHCHIAAERNAKVHLPEMWPLIRRIWIQWTTPSGVSFKRGSTVRGSMIWRSWLINFAVIAQWRSHLSACVRANGGCFEHSFWTCDVLVFCSFFSTCFHKFDPC